MKLLTYNLLEGGLGRIDPIAEVIRQADPDIVVCPEATDADEFAKLAQRLGMDQFRAPNPREPEGAVGLLIKPPYELLEAVNHAPLDHRLTRSVLHAIIRTPQTQIAILGVHLHARETLVDEAIRLTELDALLPIAARFAGTPHVLAGDFNAHHPDQPFDPAKARQKTLERIKGNQLPRDVVRRILAAGYVDAHTVGRRPEQFGYTLTTSQPALRTDYIFLPPALVPKLSRCDVLAPPAVPTLARYASDHFPVLAELRL